MMISDIPGSFDLDGVHVALIGVQTCVVVRGSCGHGKCVHEFYGNLEYIGAVHFYGKKDSGMGETDGIMLQSAEELGSDVRIYGELKELIKTPPTEYGETEYELIVHKMDPEIRQRMGLWGKWISLSDILSL